MRFLIAGLGSMGKRRIRNLLALGERDIVAFDPRADRRAEAHQRYGVDTVDRVDDPVAQSADAVVISTPPDLHVPYALAAIEAGRHFFTEVSVPDPGWADVARARAARGVVAAPSCTMRFHPAIRRAKAVIDSGEIGRVLAFTHHFGEHLSRWHPWEDYRDFYVSRRRTGACREIVTFELTWLIWLCGPLHTVSAFRAQLGDLGVDIDDVYQLLLRFRSGCLGHLQVDALQRAGYRTTRVVCADGVIAWDWDERRLRVYGSDTTWREYPDTHTQNSEEGFYIDEMEAFLHAIQGVRPWPYTLDEDLATLAILEAAEQSADSGRHVELGA